MPGYTDVCDWSIPACAGEPFQNDPRGPTFGVYPRVCGGTGIALPTGSGTAGLSPRVRGNPHGVVDYPVGERSIPACAGEPDGVRGRLFRRGVYPRVCGGTPALVVSPDYGLGLSPRVRGNLRSRGPGLAPRGSIPACAGEPTEPGIFRRSLSVYPRVCGGTQATAGMQPRGRGLSPRVRGNPV